MTRKICARCKIEKPTKDFSVDRQSSDGRVRRCKTCRHLAYIAERELILKSSRQYYMDHRESVILRTGLWQKTHLHKLREYCRRWRAKNPDYQVQWNTEHPGKTSEYGKRWRTKDVQKARAIGVAKQQRRMAKKLQNGGSFSWQEWLNLKAQYDYRCLACHRQEPEIILTSDHIHPISLGGINVIGNLQPLCKSCNSRKGARLIDYRPCFIYTKNHNPLDISHEVRVDFARDGKRTGRSDARTVATFGLADLAGGMARGTG